MDGINPILSKFKKIYVGFSGGLDSCVLLHKLSQEPTLHSRLVAVHVHHGLSQNADSWAEFTEKTAQLLSISFKKFSITLLQPNNIEELAREARYNVFTSLLEEEDVLVLAHHQNDQAETVLLNLCRGAGIEGLSGMPVWRVLGKGKLYRPLLSFSRQELEQYATENQLKWIEDESNQNVCFSRNFLRHQIIPELQKYWPGVIKNLNRTALHCASARQFIQVEIETLLRLIVNEKGCLSIQGLLSYPRETQYFLLREWLTQQGLKKPSQDRLNRILSEVVMAKQDACPVVAWKMGEVRRYQKWLYAISPNKKQSKEKIAENLLKDWKRQYPESDIAIRFRRGGETMCLRGKTHELKKLFQEWHIPPWEREDIPLVYKDGVLFKVLYTKKRSDEIL